MSHGGARPGAGRKKGETTRKTREIADRATADGITPLEVMLAAMRAHWAEAEKAQGAERLAEMDKAVSHAKDAAPYMHPRLSQVSADTENKTTVTVVGGLPDAGN